MGNENMEKWSTLKEVQAYLGVGRETILWKFKISEVDDWIRSGGAADEKGEEKAE